MPSILGIKETCLYCADLAVTRDFYTGLFGFPVMVEDPSRFSSLDVGGVSVLLLFKKGATLEPMPGPEGIIPPHDGDGPVHIGFSIPKADYDFWKTALPLSRPRRPRRRAAHARHLADILIRCGQRMPNAFGSNPRATIASLSSFMSSFAPGFTSCL